MDQNEYDKATLNKPYGNPGNPVGMGPEVLAGEYRPDINKARQNQQAQERINERIGGGVGPSNMRLRDGVSEQSGQQGVQPDRSGTGAARVIAEAHREMANQPSATPLTDLAAVILKEAIHRQARVTQAAEYLDLAARYPDIARMIELSRGGLY